jgi:2-dehydropantoate 2-reductase
MTTQKIFIIGAGAIGKALAAALTHAGKEVVLLRGSVDDQPAAITGIHVELEGNAGFHAAVAVDTLAHYPSLDGLVVLTNKSYGNERLASVLRTKAAGSPLLLLQNGLGIEQVFIDNGFADIYRCVLFVTSQALAEDRVRFKPVAVSPVGVIRGSADTLRRVVEQVNGPVFRFGAEPDIGPVIWKKAIINSVFNSVCPLLEADNGVFHRNPAARRVAERVVGECVAVANAGGIPLTAGAVMESLLLISRSSDGQLISTLQDIRNKRRTEIDTLNFEIVRVARALNLESLVKETQLLGELTKLKADLAQ